MTSHLPQRGILTPNPSPHGYAAGVLHTVHGRRQREAVASPWIFIRNTDKVEGGFMVLFFGLVFSIGPPENFSANTLDTIQ